MLDPARPLILVGGGKMGEALLAGWLGRGCRPRPCWWSNLPQLGASSGRGPWRADLRRPGGAAAWAGTAAVLLAVKPQMMDAALPAYARLVAPDTLVLSIAAGKPIALFERVLGPGRAVVRPCRTRRLR